MRRTGRLARLALAGCLAALAVLVADAPAALAHGGGDATNYVSTVTDAGDPGLHWTMFGGDSLLELRNSTGEVVMVEGYEQEPYLRFVPGDGVYENVHSPAAYYNTSRYADTPLPAQADATAVPEWRKVSDGDRYAWHDHRVHWMSPVPPSPVFNDPGHDQRIFDWTLAVTVGDGAAAREVAVAGTLRWEASVPWWPPVLVLGTLMTLVVAAIAARSRPEGDRWPAPARAAVVMIWLTLVAVVVRIVDDITAIPHYSGGSVGVAVTSAVTVGAVVLLTRHAWRGHLTGYLALAGAGIATAVLVGSQNSLVLSASQLLTRLPYWVARGAIAASIAVVAPVAVACAVAAVRIAPRWHRGVPGDNLSDDSAGVVQRQNISFPS